MLSYGRLRTRPSRFDSGVRAEQAVQDVQLVELSKGGREPLDEKVGRSSGVEYKAAELARVQRNKLRSTGAPVRVGAEA